MPAAREFWAGVRGVFTDLDGTLTTDGRILASTYAAVEALAEAGVPVVVVTGRPAGWGHALVTTWPVRAVVTENGGVSFVRLGRRLKKLLAVPPARLARLRRRMLADAARVTREVGARLSADSIYTEVDLAIDWNEEARLDEAHARRAEALLRGRGWNAVRSSVHVNFWPRGFDKLTACRRVVAALGGRAGDLAPYLYVGDALNDEPMFRGFPRSVGVANVRKVWDELAARPAVVTRAAEGRGFEEVARAILRSAGRGSSARRPARSG
jgi:HAD superfamily hydrolase (TIGR01484 family)